METVYLRSRPESSFEERSKIQPTAVDLLGIIMVDAQCNVARLTKLDLHRSRFYDNPNPDPRKRVTAAVIRGAKGQCQLFVEIKQCYHQSNYLPTSDFILYFYSKTKTLNLSFQI